MSYRYMSYRYTMLALAVSVCGSTAAFGQSVTARSFQANQLGIMEYCQAQGLSSDEAIRAQRNIINHTNPGGPVEAAEAAGRQGIFTAADGTTKTLDSMIAAHHTTLAEVCHMYTVTAIRNSNR